MTTPAVVSTVVSYRHKAISTNFPSHLPHNSSTVKCKYFLIGCESFVLAVDHKPLLGILSDRSLEEIENPRLVRLKEKTLRYNFHVIHVSGKLHKTADATSRGAVSAAEDGEALTLSTLWRLDCEEDVMTVEDQVDGLAQCVLSGLLSSVSVEALHASALTWEMVKEASDKDKELSELCDVLEAGTEDGVWPQHLMTYHAQKKHLSVQRDRKSTRLNSSHSQQSRMPSSA